MLGDSAVCIGDVLKKEVGDAIVWFLDGHFSGGETGRGTCDVPLLLELRAISEARRAHRDIIIVDDLRLFGTSDKEDWSEISEASIRSCFNPGDIRDIVNTNDRCVLYLSGCAASE